MMRMEIGCMTTGQKKIDMWAETKTDGLIGKMNDGNRHRIIKDALLAARHTGFLHGSGKREFKNTRKKHSAPITERQKNEVLRLFEAGFKQCYIAKRIGIEDATVSHVLWSIRRPSREKG